GKARRARQVGRPGLGKPPQRRDTLVEGLSELLPGGRSAPRANEGVSLQRWKATPPENQEPSQEERQNVVVWPPLEFGQGEPEMNLEAEQLASDFLRGVSDLGDVVYHPVHDASARF